MKNIKTAIFIFTFMCCAWGANAQRVVGYLPSYRSSVIPSLPYNCLTDIYFSFINFNSSGNLYTTLTTGGGDASATFGFDAAVFANVKPYCKPASASGPNLWVSVGGADAGNLRRARFSAVCGNATARAQLVSDLVAFANTHNLYGIDIDWEFPTTAADKNNHQAFLQQLRAALPAAKKICIAVGGEYKNASNHLLYINQGAIQYCDFVNVMTYDLPASYSADHANLNDTQLSLQAWAGTNSYGISVPWSKLNLGIPYYGWDAARSGTREYMTDANYQTAYNTGGNVAGYYYNSKATMDSKVDWIMAQGGSGVFMWDLGMDRYGGAWSYTSAICTRMATACAAPQPNLGADVGLCLPGTVTLNSNVAAQAGRTFSWTRNGSPIAGATNPTYGATQGGTYVVTVTQGTCSRTDNIVVTAANPVTATGATRCGPGTVTLNVTSTGGTYEWYNQASGGTLLYTGASYTTPSLSSTTNYYVQESTGSQTYYTAKPAISVPAAQNEMGEYTAEAHWAHKTTVSQTLMLQSVVIHTSGQAMPNARLVAYSSIDGLTRLYQSAVVNIPAMTAGTPYTFAANLTLVPGTYYIGIHVPGATGAAGPGVWLETAGPATPYTIAGVISIEGRCYVNWGSGFAAAQTPANYGQLFNWTVITGTAPPCGRTTVIATIKTCVAPNISITSPADPTTHPNNSALSMTSSVSDPDGGTITGVVYKVRNSSNVVIATIPGGAGPNYTGSWTPTVLGTYTITAEATDNDVQVGISSSVTVNVFDPLPVVIINFTGTRQNDHIILEWSTAQEINNSHFEIQSSANGESFQTIGQVAGAGTSTEVHLYSFTQQVSGLAYYRLAQVDLNGTVTYSEIIVIEESDFTHASASPNPFEEEFVLQLNSAEEVEVKIYDVTGLKVYSGFFKGNIALGK
ncbi:MAG: hypothetical protein K2X86_07435, partial [Cytophagaceae bacterium]|nr:hypothetical protein [Cytophagaceae bacterium]